MNDGDIHVAGNEVNYHIVELQPTHYNIISTETILNHDLNALKYEVTLLQMG